ncbi:MAG: Glutamine--scyllo-inositol transaminase [Planctomycetaceae bacterium]|nr:Glutamine--scyllo-inositol transaminase [Planctomycetaceae bacterium]
MKRTELFRPTLGAAELAAIKEVFDSGWIGYGPRCEGVERSWAFSVGARHGIATNSCTSALQIALRLRGVGPGDSVIVPTVTFAATAEAVMACGATPIFCDVYPDTLLIDIDSLEGKLLPRLKAIIVVLYAGQPFDLGDSFQGIPIIYDCAHAAGSSFDAAGKLCCWSFQAVKNLGCGDGGMVTTDSDFDQARGKTLCWHGITRSTWDRSSGKHYTWDYDVSEPGIKGQMNDITAAILSVQIGRMGELQAARRSIAYQYLRELRDVPVVGTPEHYDRSSWHLFVIKSDRRNELADYLGSQGIVTGVHYRPLHLHTAFRGTTSLPVAEAEWQKILSLPIHAGLKAHDVSRICELIHEFKATKEMDAAA